MDMIRKSVREQQLTLFIVIRRVGSLALTCFDGFLGGLILITNIRKIISCVIIGNYVKPSAAASGFYDEEYLLRYASIKIISSGTRGQVKEKKRHVCK